MNKYNVSAFFFQLIASEILQFKLSADGMVKCVFGRDNLDEYEHLNKLNWEGFTFRTMSSNKVLGFAQSVLGRPAFSRWWWDHEKVQNESQVEK